MANSYFIGLGGCGLKTVAQLYKKLHPLDPKGEEYLFTFIDTDEETRNALNSTAPASSPIVNEDDFINLGATNPYQLYQSALNSNSEDSTRLKEWVIEQGVRGHLTLPNQVLAKGAKAVRMIGRTAISKFKDTIISEISNKLKVFQKMKDADVSKTVDPNIWVFASSCGGTGSSLTLDILYIINRIFIDEMGMHDPDVKLVLFMPQPFIDMNRDNTHHTLNAYAYMWELNAFRLAYEEGMGDLYGEFAAYAPNPKWTKKAFEMFSYVIPVDAESNQHYKINVEQELYPTVAEMVYYLTMGNVQSDTFSTMSNDIRNLPKNHEKHGDTRCPWTRPLIAYGYRSIVKANMKLEQYLETRGMYELVKYGLLGDEPMNEERERVKTEFANNYITPYLMTLNGICTADGANSLETQIANIYEDIRAPKAESLTEQIARFSIGSVEDKASSPEMVNAKNVALNAVKQQINQGVSEAIRLHGLNYTVTLLHLVDDHYLETVIKSALDKLLNEEKQKRDDSKATCERYIAALKKNAKSFAAAFTEYCKSETRVQTIIAAIELVNLLTKDKDGYLEELRRGTNNKVGLKTLIEKSNRLLEKYTEKFDYLAKEFCATEQDAFTMYLPNLKDIALGDNQDWPSGTVFDNIYAESILDYDRQKVNATEDKHIPVRTAEGNIDCCLFHYLQAIDKEGNLFVKLAQKNMLELGKLFEQNVEDALLKMVHMAIESPKGTSGPWLKQSLASYLLDDTDKLPKGLRLDTLGAKDSIHVLYPTVSSANPATTRFFYAGASQALAEKLGYNKLDTNSKFISDTSMEDRFLIMKLPIGYDFYSYSYFGTIERMYNKHLPAIQAQAEEGGCHTHKIFTQLVAQGEHPITQFGKTKSLSTFTEALFYQFALKALKSGNRDIYNQILGINELFVPASDGGDAASAGGFAGFAGFGDAGLEPATNTLDMAAITENKDGFIDIEYRLESGKWQMVLTLRDLKLDPATQTINISADMHKSISIDHDSLFRGEAFVKALLKDSGNGKIADSMETYVKAFRTIFSNPMYRDALRKVYAAAKAGVLDMGTPPNQPKFAAFVGQWMRNPINNDYVRAINSALTSLI